MTPEEFYDWLEERDALHPFIDNCKYYLDDLDDEIATDIREFPTLILGIYFVWEHSTQSDKYWKDLDEEFLEYYRNLPKKSSQDK